MKIKEKGLTGKAADLRRQNIAGAGRKGFNAFKEMAEKEKGKGGGKRGKDEKAQPEVFLEFLGARIRVHEEDGGHVEPDDVDADVEQLDADSIEGDVLRNGHRPLAAVDGRPDRLAVVGMDPAVRNRIRPQHPAPL